ncbi:serine/threonine-protein kinase [Paraliomyxa miuraensis]|uniref:serine/threonine-protein kinase n=1 Tax=Paraliomyxa miuraensis TaxID=376150 RepID=UPI002B1CC13D|nr:serine/threonine-protein kinase [Paraliomyxa miuraensis]
MSNGLDETVEGDVTPPPSERSPSLQDTVAPAGMAPSPRPRPLRHATTPEKGTLIGRYVVLSRLGAGAMGVVVAAYDPQLDRKVALKLLRGRRRSGEQDRIRLQREAQALARLNHPHVVSVHDVGVHDGRVFVAMEFVEGKTLTQWLAEPDGPRPWPQVLPVLAAAGQGLAAAHAEGLVHRDFKPDNVMIGDDGRVRVMDFGLARSTAVHSEERDESSLPFAARSGASSMWITRAGGMMGTPAYMAPEQFADIDVDARSDQFSFCVTLHEALYGERPFPGESIPELAAAVTTGARKDPPRGIDVPGWLHRVVVRGLDPDPAARFPSMPALLAELGAAETRRRRTRRALVVGGLLGLAGLAVGVARYDHVRRVAECHAHGDGIDEVWNEQTGAALREGLLATGVAYAPAVADRVAPWFESYAESWREHATEACMRASVHQTWSPAVLDKAQWCLEDRRRGFAALVGELTQANELVVQSAIQVAAGLPPLLPCVDDGSLATMPTPPAPELRAQVHAVGERIDQAMALDRAGDYAQGLRVAEQAQDEAERLGWAPLLAGTSRIHANLLGQRAEYDRAEALAVRAYMVAVRTDAWDTAATAATDLTNLVGSQQARSDDGKLWAEHAAVAIEKARDPLQLREAARLNNLGNIYYAQDDAEQAKAHYEQALSRYREALGPRHLRVADSLNNLGNVHTKLDQTAEARALYEQSLAIRREALGSGHPTVASSLTNLGVAYANAKDYARAKELFEQALGVIEHARGARHPEVATNLNNLAYIHRMLGEHAEARPLYERAIDIKEASLGKTHPSLNTSLHGLGLALLALDRPEAAIAPLERSTALDVPLESRALAGLDLAQALWDASEGAGRDRARAHELLERLGTEVAEHDEPFKARRELQERIEAWRSQHRDPSVAVRSQ